MKLNFRDLKKQTHSIEVEDSTTVPDVKKQVAEWQKVEPSQIKLIFSGKVLADENTVGFYNIKEADHVICMISKPPKATPSTATPSTPAASAPAQTPGAPAQSQSTSTQNAPNTPTPAPTVATAQPSQRSIDDTSSIIAQPERQAAIANMEAMGFERPQIERAMRAAYHHPDRAVDYLLNGIPEHLGREPAPAARPSSGSNQPAQGTTPEAGGGQEAPAANPPAAATQDPEEPINLFEAAAAAGQQTGGGGNTGGAGRGGGAGGLGNLGAAAAAAAGGRGAGAGGAGAGAGAGAGGQGEGGGSNLEFLRNHPTFHQLRQMVQQQPNMLSGVLQQLAASNPALAEQINNNQEQFLSMLLEDQEDEGVTLPPGTREISVTEEERNAIDRLCNLGFERDLVIQAYFACDKNEELAANFLFEQPPEPDEGQ